MSFRRIAVLDALAGAIFTGLLWWGHRNIRGNRV